MASSTSFAASALLAFILCAAPWTAARAVDWSNSLLLSCRFTAWRTGEFNEYVYNFLKGFYVSPCAFEQRRVDML